MGFNPAKILSLLFSNDSNKQPLFLSSSSRPQPIVEEE
jgi:hypothetical protein